MRTIFLFLLGFLAVNCQAQKKTIATQSRIKKINLPNGTLMYLNTVSSVSYPAAFTVDNRTVEEAGEIYVEVPKTTRTFVIKAKGIGSITCQGNTRINVMNYREDSCFRLVVLAGMVILDRGKGMIELRTGYTYEIVRPANGEVLNIDTEKSIGWTKGIPDYYMLKLRVILNALQRNFGVKIEVKDSAILETTYNTSYEPGEGIETVLTELAHTGHLSFEKNGMNNYEIRSAHK